MEESTFLQMREVVDEIHRSKRNRTLLTLGVVFLLIAVATSAVFTFVNYRSDAATRAAVEQSRDQVKELCSSGAIDCRGSDGLPAPKGATGTGIADVACVNGQFVFTTTAGRKTSIGDCIAEAGARGRTGPPGESVRGPRGFTGRAGQDGESIRGPRGFTGRDGRDGARGPAGPVRTVTRSIICGLLPLILGC